MSKRQMLVAFLNSDINKRNNSMPEPYLLKSGYANGYVAVPPEHPYHGKRLLENDLQVHGGITFCDSFQSCKQNFKSIEWLTDYPDLCGDWWVIGFDTCHCFDSLESCPREYVEAQTLSLKQQLEEIYEDC